MSWRAIRPPPRNLDRKIYGISHSGGHRGGVMLCTEKYKDDIKNSTRRFDSSGTSGHPVSGSLGASLASILRTMNCVGRIFAFPWLTSAELGSCVLIYIEHRRWLGASWVFNSWNVVLYPMNFDCGIVSSSPQWGPFCGTKLATDRTTMALEMTLSPGIM